MSKARNQNCIYKTIRSLLGGLISLRSNYISLHLPLNRNEDFKPFFIIGSGRSGNTILRKILASHSGVFIPPESYVLGNVIRNYSLNLFSSWEKTCVNMLKIFSDHPEFYTFGKLNLDVVHDELSVIPKQERSLAKILDSIYMAYAKDNEIEGSLWGDKTPLNTFFISDIKKVFPKAKFIEMRRDPYDVVSSYIKSGHYPDVSSAVSRWIQSVEACEIAKQKYANDILTIKYEELVVNSEAVTKNICSFLSLDFESSMLNRPVEDLNMGDVNVLKHHENVYKSINTNSIGKGKISLTNEEKKYIDSRIKVLHLSG